LPYKDADGAVDVAHLRNALARAPQMTGVTEAQRAKAIQVLQAAAKTHLKSYKQEMEIVALALDLAESYMVEESGPEEDEALVEFAESASGHVLALAEAAPAADNVVPLHLDAVLIAPGWGNKRDNHYYPREILERDAGVFAGVKMFETDHRQDEKSTRTWVSTVKEVSGFTDDGAPVGLVSVHDRNFAERLMALAADGLLEKMECSILASGTAKKGEIGGRKGHIVEAITHADSVDWVTRAGAGGRARALVESEAGGTEPMEDETIVEESEQEIENVTISEQEPTPDPEPAPDPVKLAAEKVQEALTATNLPPASVFKLAGADYADETSLAEAIKAEVAEVKERTGSGRPFAQGGGGNPPGKEPLTEEQKAARFNEIMEMHGAKTVPTGG
ncbi:MAG: hypothetical protein KJ556_21210, partial [Gammaproteobacteria bacterium]|nr:hypothetical protein [Gammaproteobacteria bacterium]